MLMLKSSFANFEWAPSKSYDIVYFNTNVAQLILVFHYIICLTVIFIFWN